MIAEVVMLLVGLVVLYFGAEWLVGGASKLAFALGITPLIIGLTVVAYGTSAPELLVTTAASWRGQNRNIAPNCPLAYSNSRRSSPGHV